VQYQSVQTQKPSGVAGSIALGFGAAAGGGALLGLAPKLPAGGALDLQTTGRVVGAGMILGGLYAAYEAFKVQTDSGDVPHGAPTAVEESHPLSAAVPCDMKPLPPGEISLSFGEKPVATIPVASTRVLTIDIEAQRDRVCAKQSDLGKPLKIVWTAGELTQTLPPFNADDCIRAQNAAVQLAKAKEIALSATTAVRLTAAEPALRVADRLLSSVAKEHPRHDALMAQLQEVRLLMVEGARRLLNSALSGVMQTLAERGAVATVEPSTDALDLAALAPDRQRDTALAILGALASSAAKDLNGAAKAVGMLLDRRPEIRICLERSDGCPTWLAHADPVEALKPLSAELRRKIQAGTHELDLVADTFTRQPDEQTSTALRASIAGLQAMSPICKLITWDIGAHSACEEIDKGAAAGEKALTAAAEKLRQARIRRTRMEWQSMLPRCKSIMASMENLKALNTCNAACEAARERTALDFEALRSFTVENAEWDTESQAAVRRECANAHCPVCP
jgi:hypothetical protein